MDKITDNVNLGYVSYVGQIKQLRKIVIDKIGVDKVAMMSNDEVCDFIRNEGYVPLIVNLNDGCNSETIYLIKEEDLVNGKNIITLNR